jgi:16S rRNA processing protein RimM
MSSPSPASEYDVHVGKIVAVHGLRGDVRVGPMSDIPGRCHTLREVLVKTSRGASLRRVVSATQEPKGTWRLHLEGVDDRTAAEALRGALLMVREEDCPPLPEGEYYVHQIVGLQVETTDGRQLGPVTDVLETGANNVYVTDAGLIPAIPQVVKSVDLEAGKIIIEPMAGMLQDD